MSDKELVQQRIDELEAAISAGRSSGRTYRLVSKIIDELFTLPMGSQIQLIDHEGNEDSQIKLKDMLTSRMTHDFPDTVFKIVYPMPNVSYVVRMTPTYQERAKENLKRWKKKLEEMD